MGNHIEYLGLCMHCKSIRVQKGNPLWLDRETHPELYDEFMKEYENKISHGICESCYHEHYSDDIKALREKRENNKDNN